LPNGSTSSAKIWCTTARQGGPRAGPTEGPRGGPSLWTSVTASPVVQTATAEQAWHQFSATHASRLHGAALVIRSGRDRKHLRGSHCALHLLAFVNLSDTPGSRKYRSKDRPTKFSQVVPRRAHSTSNCVDEDSHIGGQEHLDRIIEASTSISTFLENS